MDKNNKTDLLIKNALIVTADSNQTVVNNGNLTVSDGKISSIFSSKQTESILPPSNSILDASGQILMPGLINTHCHAGDSLFRGLVENLPLEAWLKQLWEVEKAILTPHNANIGSILGLAENLLGGVTTLVDMNWFPEQTVKAAESVGIRIATGGIFFDPPAMGGRSQIDYEKEADDFMKKYSGSEYIFPGVLPHGAYTVCPENLMRAKHITDNYEGMFSIHAAETISEQKNILNRYGKSVIRHLNELGLLDERTILAHCVHLDKTEIEIIADKKVCVSHNPMSNLKLGAGIAPIAELMDAGVTITIGTDGAVSGNDLDLWTSLRLAATLPKGISKKPDLVTAGQALHMATMNAAKALKQTKRLGSLEIGKQADLILIDCMAIHATPMFDPITHLVYSTSKSDVRHVFVGGKQVVENGKLKKFNIDPVIKEVRELVPPILKSISRTL